MARALVMLSALLLASWSAPSTAQVSLREEACSRGEARGCQDAAEAYADGRDVARDETRAATLYGRAVAIYDAECARGEAGACLETGVLRARSGLPGDRSAGARFLGTACEGGELLACFFLGIMQLTAEDVPEDREGGLRLLQKACDGGLVSACVDLADVFERGSGVVRDVARAAGLYRKACASGRDGNATEMACSRLKAMAGVEPKDPSVRTPGESMAVLGDWRMTGTIALRDGRWALLESARGERRVVHPGDTLNEFAVAGVEAGSVSFHGAKSGRDDSAATVDTTLYLHPAEIHLTYLGPGHRGLRLKPRFSGTPVQVRADAADVREVLRQISLASGVSFDVDPGLKTAVTLDIDAPWDEVLHRLADAYQLAYVNHGRRFRVGGGSSLRARDSMGRSYTAEPAFLDLASVDVRSLLALFSDMGGWSWLLPDLDLQLSIRTGEMPNDQMLDLVLEASDLGVRIENDVRLFLPRERLATLPPPAPRSGGDVALRTRRASPSGVIELLATATGLALEPGASDGRPLSFVILRAPWDQVLESVLLTRDQGLVPEKGRLRVVPLARVPAGTPPVAELLRGAPTQPHARR